MASRLGLTNQKKWTEDELTIINEFYSKESIKQLAKRLPGRTVYAITGVAINKLNIRKSPNWTDEEKNLMHKYYGKEPAKITASRIGRNIDAVIAMAARMGIKDHRNIKRRK